MVRRYNVPPVEREEVPQRSCRIAEYRVKPILDSMPLTRYALTELAIALYLQGFCDCHNGLTGLPDEHEKAKIGD